MRIKAVEGIKAYNRGSDLWSCVRPSIRPSVYLPRISSVYPSVFLSGNLSFSLQTPGLSAQPLSLSLSPSSARPGVLAKIIRRRKLHLSLFEWNTEEIKTLS